MFEGGGGGGGPDSLSQPPPTALTLTLSPQDASVICLYLSGRCQRLRGSCVSDGETGLALSNKKKED